MFSFSTITNKCNLITFRHGFCITHRNTLRMKHLLQHLFSPKYFYQFSRKCLPWFYFIFFISFFYGLIGGLILSPPDYQQGDAYLINTSLPSTTTGSFSRTHYCDGGRNQHPDHPLFCVLVEHPTPRRHIK